MSTMIKCDNCRTTMGSLQDAFVWLDHPVCPECYQTLKSSRGEDHSARKWKLFTIISATSAACVLAALLFVIFNRPRPGDVMSSNRGEAGGAVTNNDSRIAVHAAFYGQNVSWLDVTDKIETVLADKSKLSLAVNSATLGEPAPGWTGTRTLLVRYTHSGKSQFKGVYEGEVMSLP